MDAIWRGASLGVAVGFAVVLSSLLPTRLRAAPQESPSASSQVNATDETENNGQDVTRPESLIQMRDTYTTAPGTGQGNGTTRQVTTDTVTLRADRRIDLVPQWAMDLRTDVPFAAKNPITADNPDGDFLYGAGDADVQAALVHSFDARWAMAFGARIVAPTGGDTFGTGKWQVLPGLAVRTMLPQISEGSYFVPQVRYDASFAGDPTRRNISNLQFSPTLNIALPQHWFFTFYPSTDIRLNYGDPITGQTGRLFLPFDVMIGRIIARNVVMSLEMSVPIVKDYPLYNFKTEARFNVRF